MYLRDVQLNNSASYFAYVCGTLNFTQGMYMVRKISETNGKRRCLSGQVMICAHFSPVAVRFV